MIITAGFHGEEQAGPLTILKRGEEIVEYARSRGVAVSIYPCINPSGFEDKRRYNRSGEKPNNAFLEYEISPREWDGELPIGESFRRTRIYTQMPKETKALYERIKGEDPVALLDLHQDNELEGSKTYAYVFGDRQLYIPIVQAASEHLEVARNHHEIYNDIDIDFDEHGLAEFSDGSIIDYFWRQGTDYLCTIETTTRAPLKLAMEVNIVWAKGLIDLVAKRGDVDP